MSHSVTAAARRTPLATSPAIWRPALILLAVMLAVWLMAGPALAHEIGGRDAAFVARADGPDIFPFMYLGAKHMVTGYDHLLFLLGVIFFLRRPRDILVYVTLFSVGHSITLLAGVLLNWAVSPYLVDAVIGLSVAYKAFDNLNGFRTVFGVQPDNRSAVFCFGLIHGLGLATKVQALSPPRDGLTLNILSFNLGVEIGQIIALSAMLALVVLWRATASFQRLALAANVALMVAGFVLAGVQIAGFFTQA